jgi:thiol:disulfide interchange protein DsbA
MKKWLLMALLMVSGFANAASELGKDYVLMESRSRWPIRKS